MTYRPADYFCYNCKKDFTLQEEIYSIRNLWLEGSPYDDKLHWRWIKESDDVDPVDFYFHRECFEEVAGTLFMGGLKQ